MTQLATEGAKRGIKLGEASFIFCIKGKMDIQLKSRSNVLDLY